MRKGKGRSFWSHGVAVLVLLAGASTAGADTPTVIVPGQTLGPVSLGMSVDEVTAVLGQPVQGRNGALAFPSWKISVAFDAGLAVQINTTDPQFRTRRGAGIGTSPEVATQLVGDLNAISTASGNDLTTVFPFQGVGFVFRDERAVEVFVLKPIILPSIIAPVAPQPPTPPPTTDLGDLPQPPAPVPPSAAAPGAMLKISSLAETVDVVRGRLQVSGQIANTGSQPVGPVTVTATFVAADHDETQSQLSILQPLSPGGATPFTLETPVVRSVVTEYTVEVATRATGAGATGGVGNSVLEHQTVPVALYTSLAQQQIQVSAQLGGPSNTVPMVQVLVSITATGSIPRAWVRQVQVEVPFTGGARTLALAPGDVQTVLIPAIAQLKPPQIQGVVLSATP